MASSRVGGGRVGDGGANPVAEKQATAAENQAKALVKSFKSPILAVPTFNPNECKGNPLVWTMFKARFNHFSKNCVDDESKLSFLFQAVKGDAVKVIQGLSCTEDNFEIALKLLEDEYNKPAAVKHMLLLNAGISKLKIIMIFLNYTQHL